MTPAQIALAKQLIQQVETLSPIEMLTRLKELGQDPNTLNAIALVQGPKKMTFLHHLLRVDRGALVEEYIKYLDPVTLNTLINTPNSSGSNPIDTIGFMGSAEASLMSLLTKASPQACSLALTSGRPVSKLENLVSTSSFCSESLKQQLLKVVSVADLNKVMQETDILGNINGKCVEFIARVDLKILESRLSSLSQIKSSPVFGNTGGPDLVRVIALEKTSKELFAALINRGVSLEVIYKNLFTLDKIKLSGALYSPSKMVMENSKAGGLLVYTLPFAAVAALISTAELVTRTHGINWSPSPDPDGKELDDLLFLKLNEMEFAWLNDRVNFDMKKILALKKLLTPTSEKAKLQQAAIYQAFGKYCKLKQEKWQEKLAHLTAAAEMGSACAQESLTEYHREEVQQLNLAVHAEKTRATALKRLIQLKKLGDSNALVGLREYYNERIQFLVKPDLTTKELKELKEIVNDYPNAAIVLGRYYENLVKNGKNYRSEAWAAFNLPAHSAAGNAELARCYCEGLIVKQDEELGLSYYFLAASMGHALAKQTLEKQAVSESTSLKQTNVLAIVLLELLNNRSDSPQFINAIKQSPELVAKYLFEAKSLAFLQTTSFRSQKIISQAQMLQLIESFNTHCPETAIYCKELASKRLAETHRQTPTRITIPRGATSSTAAVSVPNSHQAYLNFCQNLQSQLTTLEYKGDIPENLCTQRFEIMENPWQCNDGYTYCMKRDLPDMLGKPAPKDSTIQLAAIAPDHDRRRACLEFVERVKLAKQAVELSASPIIRRDSFQNTETLSLLFPATPTAPIQDPFPKVPNGLGSVDDDGDAAPTCSLTN